MTIASAFNEIAVAQGGTADKSGTITGAVDALNDALAGSDQEQGRTIEDAVRLLGAHIGGGGSSVTVESLTATENKTYTAPEGKAYSPVVVNVSGGGSQEYNISCYEIQDDAPVATSDYFGVGTYVEGAWVSNATVNKAHAGDVISLVDKDSAALLYLLSSLGQDSVLYPFDADSSNFIMPSHDVFAITSK